MARTVQMLLRAWRGGAIMAAALALASCERSKGDVYQRPPSEIRELLRTVEVPLYMFGSSAETDAEVDSSDPATIVWKITADDSPLMKFTATLVPEGDSGTRVAVDVEGARAGKYGDVQARLEKMREIRTLYLVSMTEAVDSTLDGRAYDITRTYPALITAGSANASRLFPPSPDGSNSSSSGNHR